MARPVSCVRRLSSDRAQLSSVLFFKSALCEIPNPCVRDIEKERNVGMGAFYAMCFIGNYWEIAITHVHNPYNTYIVTNIYFLMD